MFLQPLLPHRPLPFLNLPLLPLSHSLHPSGWPTPLPHCITPLWEFSFQLPKRNCFPACYFHFHLEKKHFLPELMVTRLQVIIKMNNRAKYQRQRSFTGHPNRHTQHADYSGSQVGRLAYMGLILFLHVTVKYADKWIKTRRIGIRTEGKQSCRWVNFSQPNQPNPQDTPTLSISDGRKQGERKTNYSWLISAVCTKEDKDLKAADETYRLIALKIMNAAMRNRVKTEGGSAWDRKLHSALWCTLCFKNVYHPSLSVILTARFQ